MSYQNDLNRYGSVGGSACFCSGACWQLGYCPNQNQWQQRTQPNVSLYDYLRQRGIANAPRTPVRQMTAEDLGISKPSYAFWLGAEG